jgi:hypothetical protein
MQPAATSRSQVNGPGSPQRPTSRRWCQADKGARGAMPGGDSGGQWSREHDSPRFPTRPLRASFGRLAKRARRQAGRARRLACDPAQVTKPGAKVRGKSEFSPSRSNRVGDVTPAQGKGEGQEIPYGVGGVPKQQCRKPFAPSPCRVRERAPLTVSPRVPKKSPTVGGVSEFSMK